MPASVRRSPRPSGRKPARPAAARPRAAVPATPDRDGALAVPRRLPRGMAGLPQEVVVLSQRARLVEATAHVVAEKGYAAASVADIIAHAGVSRATFYEIYEDKEDCFLSCFLGLSRSLTQAVTGALDSSGPLPERLLACVRTYLRRIDADRWFARAFIAEAEGASPRVREAFEGARRDLDLAIRGWFAEVRAAHPAVPAVADATHELLQAGLGGFVIGRIRGGSLGLEPEAPILASFVFATLGLHGWAHRTLRDAAAFGSPLR